jgi:YHS domain-containing protein
MQTPEEIMERDPVCGMEIERERAAGQSEFEGKAYYFCSPGCRNQFEKAPERYGSKTPAMR